jgi:hypothetical protein
MDGDYATAITENNVFLAAGINGASYDESTNFY